MTPTTNKYISAINTKAYKFLLERGYKLTFKVVSNEWRGKGIYYVDFPGSGREFHKFLEQNNLLLSQQDYEECFSHVPLDEMYPTEELLEAFKGILSKDEVKSILSDLTKKRIWKQ